MVVVVVMWVMVVMTMGCVSKRAVSGVEGKKQRKRKKEKREWQKNSAFPSSSLYISHFSRTTNVIEGSINATNHPMLQHHMRTSSFCVSPSPSIISSPAILLLLVCGGITVCPSSSQSGKLCCLRDPKRQSKHEQEGPQSAAIPSPTGPACPASFTIIHPRVGPSPGKTPRSAPSAWPKVVLKAARRPDCVLSWPPHWLAERILQFESL